MPEQILLIREQYIIIGGIKALMLAVIEGYALNKEDRAYEIKQEIRKTEDLLRENACHKRKLEERLDALHHLRYKSENRLEEMEANWAGEGSYAEIMAANEEWRQVMKRAISDTEQEILVADKERRRYREAIEEQERELRKLVD